MNGNKVKVSQVKPTIQNKVQQERVWKQKATSPRSGNPDMLLIKEAER